jgi:hypothetical protein
VGSSFARSGGRKAGRPVCACGFPLRLVRVDPVGGEIWACSACGGGPVVFPRGTHADTLEGIREREAANRPPNENRLRGLD